MVEQDLPVAATLEIRLQCSNLALEFDFFLVFESCVLGIHFVYSLEDKIFACTLPGLVLVL